MFQMNQIKRLKKIIITILIICTIPVFSVRGETPKSNYSSKNLAISILKFFPLRTVIKVNKNTPLFAEVKNNGDTATFWCRIILPDGVQLVKGEEDKSIGTLKNGEVIDLNWAVKFNHPGEFTLSLIVYNENYSRQKDITVDATDRYWTETDFYLSAYNPPYSQHGPPYDDSVLEYYRDANFHNLMWVRDEDELINKMHEFGFTYLLDIADIVGEDNLRGDPYIMPPPINDQQLQDIENAVNRHIDDPLLIGYYLCDEPFPTGFQNIAKVIKKIREIDPERPCLVNLWPYFPADDETDYEIGDDAYVETFLQTTKAEILCYDRYIFYNEGYDEQDYYFDQIERIRKFSLLYNLPFYNIIQGVGTNGTSVEYLDWRTPDENEMRWLVYTTLTYGAHGIIWFHWDHEWGVTGNPCGPQVYPQIQRLNAEINKIGPIMVKLKTTLVYHTDRENYIESIPLLKRMVPPQNSTLIVGFFKDKDGFENYFMLMNKDYKHEVNGEVKFDSTLSKLKVFNIETGAWEDVPFQNSLSGSSFNIHLRKGGGKLFYFERKTDYLPTPVIDINRIRTLSE